MMFRHLAEILESREGDINTIIRYYRGDHQELKLIEEMGELQQAIIKCQLAETREEQDKAFSSMEEEIADVVLLIAQLMTYEFGAHDIARIIEEKLDRQIKRIQDKI